MQENNKNMTFTSHKLPIVILLSVVTIFAFVPFAEAESVIWNSIIKEDLYSPSPLQLGTAKPGAVYTWYEHGSHLIDPSVSVQYKARAVLLDENEKEIALIPCGSIVPRGTKVRFEIVPHRPEDIYWFTTGYDFDTPYGDWSSEAIPAKDICVEKNFVFSIGITFPLAAGYYIYSAFAVTPPVTSISVHGTANPSCSGNVSDMKRTCTLESQGDVTADISFAKTGGFFYGGLKYAYDTHNPGVDTTKCFSRGKSLEVNYLASPNYRYVAPTAQGYGPAYHYVAPTGQGYVSSAVFAEQAPVVVPAQTISCPITIGAAESPSTPVISGGSCTVDTPYSISVTSTDPDGHQLKYGVDWDADGTIDQFVPPSGYVNSGVTQSAFRLYSLAGHKQIRVIAINDQGARSAWSAHAFTCQNKKCSLLPRCSGDDLVDSCTGATIQTCSYGCRLGACVVVTPPSATLRATPSLVHSGDTTVVSWTSQNTSSCTLSGTNGNSWTGISSSGKTSSPIIGQTIYTLHCIGNPGAQPPSVDKSVTVNLIPSFNEK